MGYNTAVMVLNDAMENLKTDPNVGRNLYAAMLESSMPEYRQRGRSFSIGNHCNGGLVLESRHADDVQIIAVGKNYMERVASTYHVDMGNPVEVLKAAADALGYRLVKKPAR